MGLSSFVKGSVKYTSTGRKIFYPIFVSIITATLILQSTEILLDNMVVPHNATASTRVGTFSIPGETDSAFQFTDTGEFINAGEFTLPYLVDCTGGTSDTSGVSPIGGVATTEDCDTIYTLDNSLFYLEGNDLIVSGALSFSEQLSFHIGIKGSSNLGSSQKIFKLIKRSTNPFSDVKELGGGWMESSWFGIYFQSPESSWIYHETLGWVYLELATNLPGELFWQEDFGWSWIDNSLHPIIYMYAKEAWVYYLPEASPTPFYGNHSGRSLKGS